MTTPTATRRTVIHGGLALAATAILPTGVSDASAGATSNPTKAGAKTMSTIATKDGTEIFYKDWGKGQPIVFHHGWPLSADDWDNQMMFFLAQGYRVIAHDRRGHGRSTQTDTGNEMDTYASDVTALAEALTSGAPSMSAIPPAAARWCTTWRSRTRPGRQGGPSSARCRRSW